VHAADIIILLVLALPALVGAMYGFLNILFSLIAWIIALGAAVKFNGAVAPLLAAYIDTVIIRDVLAFITVFVVSLMLCTALGYLAVKLLGRAGLTATDRMLGFFFGLGLGAVIVAATVFLAGFTGISKAAWWQQSTLIEPFERVSIWARRFLPDNVVAYHRYDVIDNRVNP